jgi:hypothetical protein
MNPKYLELSRSQLTHAWNRSRFNHYSDKRKQQFHECLGLLYEELMKKNFSDPSYTKDELRFFRKVLEFFKDSLALLDNNTISSVPHELIECLNTAARQWVSDFDDYIIVMEEGPYAIIPQVEDFRLFYVTLKAKLGVEFKYILLRVRMPRQLARDYLTNVCLFHELGHFVDAKYKISERLIYDLFNIWVGGERVKIDPWFVPSVPPFIVSSTPGAPVTYIPAGYLLFFLMEYFADLFGAQYVGENYLNYLEYSCDDINADDPQHPSYGKRKLMYEDFCKGPDANVVLKIIFEKTLALTKHGLTKRYVELDNSNMLGLVPTTLKSTDEMLSIFKMGWNVYMMGAKEFEKANNLIHPLGLDQVYTIVNNLIEKSISNYLIITEWEAAKGKI